MVLVGVHPTLTQVPPTYSRSTTAVRRPAPPRSRASGFPAWPVPRTIASKRSGSIIMPRQQGRVVWLPRYLPAGSPFSFYALLSGDEPRWRHGRESSAARVAPVWWHFPPFPKSPRLRQILESRQPLLHEAKPPSRTPPERHLPNGESGEGRNRVEITIHDNHKPLISRFGTGGAATQAR